MEIMPLKKILGQYWEKPWPVTSSTLAETEVSLPLSSPATVNTICNGNLDTYKYDGGRVARQNMEQFQIVDMG